jgi:glycerophosphoryl diester phosphodiesterase
VRVGRLTRSEIAKRTGKTPPLLEEVLRLAQGHVKLDVELKEDGYVDLVMAELDRYFGPEDMIVTSFLDDVLVRVKQAAHVKTGLVLGIEQPGIYLRTELRNLFPEARLRRCAADYVVPPIELAAAGVLGARPSARFLRRYGR